MGRSIPSFRQLLEIEKLNWSCFKKLLPSKKDKQELDKVFDSVRLYTSYLGNASNPFVVESVMMGAIFHNYKQMTFLQTLQSIPMDKPAIHDIRLSFTFKHLWSILSVSESPLIKSKDLENNFDIILQDIEVANQKIKTTVHKTDTVSVIVGCSVSPISIDLFGLVRLTSSIARAEERLQLLVNEYNTTRLQSGRQQYLSLALNSKIPDHMK
jgi:hypothetical protein